MSFCLHRNTTWPHRDSEEQLRALAPNWRARVPDYNVELRAFAADERAFLIDVQRHFAGGVELFADECHFNEAGRREMSRLLAERLRAWGLLPPSARAAPADRSDRGRDPGAPGRTSGGGAPSLRERG